jgi:ferredoxin-NADP reductase
MLSTLIMGSSQELDDVPKWRAAYPRCDQDINEAKPTRISHAGYRFPNLTLAKGDSHPSPNRQREVAWPVEERPLAFVCGPTSFVESVAAGLLELGYAPGRIKTERFGATGER